MGRYVTSSCIFAAELTQLEQDIGSRQKNKASFSSGGERVAIERALSLE